MFHSLLASIYSLIFPSYSLIIPNLWLGDINAAHNYDFFKKNKIDIIVNCSKDIPFIFEINEKVKDLELLTYRLTIDDSLLEKDFIKMEEYFETVLPIIFNHYKQGKKILIHCFAGKQRSAMFTAALLKVMLDNSNELEFENLKNDNDKKKQFDNIINFILSKRYHAFTFGYRINFKKSYERHFKLYDKFHYF